MVFSSISFLYYFLPMVLLLYAVTPYRYKNITLFASSLIFYFAGEPIFFMLLIFSSLIDYTHSRTIERHRGTGKAKRVLVRSLILNLGLLIVFKYGNFIVDNINVLFSTDIVIPTIPLPIGISFFTFQTMSYTIDVYRGQARAQKSFLGVGTFVALFPQLIAGPIVRYKSVEKELTERVHSLELFGAGVERFIIGLGKKVLLANTLAVLAEKTLTASQPSVLHYWLGAVAFTFQIYFDFSGYSDMAIGLGKMFGFHFPENFNYPYMAKSITDFWRRWHMSLGQWFRDYVYIPLGGNRVGKTRWFLNIFIVWFLTGLWHGASWNYVLWGILFGSLLILEKYGGLTWLKKIPVFFQHVYVLCIVLFSFVIFKYESMQAMMEVFKGMFGRLDIPIVSRESLIDLEQYIVTFIIAAIGATSWPKTRFVKLQNNHVIQKVYRPMTAISLLILMLMTTGYLVDGSFNPFLYFRF
jgi:alginate O-acetyltransferase complex protein AlgI